MGRHISSKKASKKSGVIFQVKISLIDAHLPIWRRVLVPGLFNLKQFHEILQMAMGWDNKHMYNFEINGEEYGEHEAEFEGDKEVKKAWHYPLSDIASKSNQFIYNYDYGDDWRHEVHIEKDLKWDENYNYPVCVGGENACPPEDCGGILGYEERLKEFTY